LARRVTTKELPRSGHGRRPARTHEEPKARPRLNLGVLPSLLGFHVRRAQLKVFEDFQRAAPTPTLAPGQFGILVIIDGNPDMTQQQLCEGIGRDKSTFTVSLHRLADLGLIHRVRSDVDRRQNSLRLTAKGVAVLRAMLAHVERHERRVFAKLTASERKVLLEMLTRIGEPEVSR
jgi:DNA-binding MarR family transcriptional regulator